MENQIYYLSQNLALLLILVISLVFALIGILYSKKYRNLSNYLTAGRNIGSLSFGAIIGTLIVVKELYFFGIIIFFPHIIDFLLFLKGVVKFPVV